MAATPTPLLGSRQARVTEPARALRLTHALAKAWFEAGQCLCRQAQPRQPAMTEREAERDVCGPRQRAGWKMPQQPVGCGARRAQLEEQTARARQIVEAVNQHALHVSDVLRVQVDPRCVRPEPTLDPSQRSYNRVSHAAC